MRQSDPLLQEPSEQVGRAHARALARSRPVVADSRIRGAQQPQSLPPPAEGPAALIHSKSRVRYVSWDSWIPYTVRMS